MKFLKFITGLTFSFSALTTLACGPDYYELPYPDFLQLTQGIAETANSTENLELWRSQTSKDIKLEDINAVIYGDVSPDCCGPISVCEVSRPEKPLLNGGVRNVNI
ncbi:MAG: hypothetical protein NC201_03445, partial [Prevotella sp.]|nr:hypothetical protein [Bacteroides sp.]MCM1366282.1 hypothetical protein [Prevotella sp.]MCM1436314.1 hypothetical protein [Prevotella sp.]